MATITPVAATSAAAVQTLAAATSGGDTIATSDPNLNGQYLFVVNNASGASINVTFAGVRNCSQGSTHNVVTAVAAGKLADIPIPAQCVDPASGNVGVTYSAVTSVTVGALITD